MKNNNEKALEIIGQQYTNFIDLQDPWDFFSGLAEYTKTLQEMTPIQPFIKALEAQQQIAQKTYQLVNTKSMQELTKSANRLTSIAEDVMKRYTPLIKQAQQVAEKYQPVIKNIQEIQDQMEGRLTSSNPLSFLNNNLLDIARFFKESGHEEVFKEFENNNKKNHNIYGDYTFSPTYGKIEEERIKLARKEQVEPWGAWQYLPITKQLVFEPEEIRTIVKEELDKWTWFNFGGVANEMEKIRMGKGSDNDFIFFRIKKFKSLARRVNNFITTELLKADTKEEILDFDDSKSILYFDNEEILISKRAENDAHELLKIIFRNKSKLWNNDEILDKWAFDHTKEHIPKNKAYHAGQAVNRTIAQETKIKDFLIVTTKTIAINKKYLKK